LKDGKIQTSKVSLAYQCPFCGFVKGNFQRKHYRSPEEDWLALVGREGEQYYYRICGTRLGHYYWAMS